MANRLDTYERLISTYREEIGKLDVTISAREDLIAGLRRELETETRKLEQDQVERADQTDQLRGIRDVVTKMKVTQLIRSNAAEDHYLD